MQSVESPCILVCAIEPLSGYCYGCGRTGAEIAGWLAMGAAERRSVMEGLPARLAGIERRPRRETRRARLRREGGTEAGGGEAS